MNIKAKLNIVLLAAVLSVCWLSGVSAAQNDDWRLGIQAWSFRKFTFFEAVDKTASLGLKYIEAYPGQKFSADRPDARFVHTQPPD